MTFGERIRELRVAHKLPLRTVAAELDIDQAILSKIERSQKKASRKHVMKLSAFFNTNSNDLLVEWLSDNLADELKNEEEVALEALLVAREKVSYNRRLIASSAALIKLVKDFFRKDGRVSRVWLFGSYARGEERKGSDLDLMVSYSAKATGTLLDYADIKYQLELLLNLKVDLVEEGFVKPFAVHAINRDKILIYG